jgi:hypothetical protein
VAASLYMAVRADISPSAKCLDVSHRSFLDLNSVQLSIFPVPLSSSCSLSNIRCLGIGLPVLWCCGFRHGQHCEAHASIETSMNKMPSIRTLLMYIPESMIMKTIFMVPTHGVLAPQNPRRHRCCHTSSVTRGPTHPRPSKITTCGDSCRIRWERSERILEKSPTATEVP